MEHEGGETADAVEKRGTAAATLWRAVRHDPKRLPEHLAELAADQESAPAAKAVTRLSGTLDERRDTVVTHGIRLTMTEGCLVGGPLILLVPVAFCAAMLAQARMVLELAELAGAAGDRTDRAAELLVLQGVYDTTEQARAALADTPAPPPPEPAAEPAADDQDRPTRRSWATRLDMIRRMAYLLGLVGLDQAPRGWLRRIAGWVGVTLLIIVGLAFPVVWIPVMGRATAQATTALAHRAIAYYWPTGGADRPPREGHVRAATVAVLGQTLLAVLIPSVVYLGVLFLGLELVGGRFTTAALLAVAAGAAYAAHRAHRAHRARRGPRH
ncbi:hypothetical protein [Streptomyces sp. TLI_171]|uniref:hypothetical protein n=1 Tax=Streptomyces sp. TLI_171 TaxID=1938859 RepID=UPI000C1A4AF5|nr:hypothetical protein [Streptomyces sp. TLI_171]RKE22896.1 hypothetical protein BX266_6351 [Streptomyces sp. TLI_171]